MTGSGMGEFRGTAAGGGDLAAAERYLAERFAAGAGAAPPPTRVASRAAGRLAAAAREIFGRLRGLLSASRLGAAPRRTLWVAERLDLGPKKSLWLVGCGERRLLVAGGGEAIAAMLDLGPAADAAGRIPVVLPARWMAER